jgi:hypothetical protein
MKKALLFVLLPFLGIAQIKIGLDINGSTTGENSGQSVSISANGSIVAIGAHLNDTNGTDSGCVRIYKNVSGAWTQQDTDINGESAGDQSGWCVSLSADGKTVAIGAPRNAVNGINTGHVRIYKYIGETWTQFGNDIDGLAAGDQLGFSISLSADGNNIAIGSPFRAIGDDDSGVVRVFRNIGGLWTQQGNDINSAALHDNFGRSVAISSDGTVVAIGAPYNSLGGNYVGRVKVYKNIAGVWTQVGSDIRGEAANDVSGYSISMNSDGTTIAIGAIGNRSNTGHVRVYKEIAGNWTQQGVDIDGEAVNNTSGRSVSLSADGSIVAIGANGNSDNGTSSGHVRIYKNISGIWTQLGIDIDGESAADQSGWSVALSADANAVIIGSPYNTTNGLNSGQARVYDISALLASDNFVLANFNVYPNPVSSVLTIELPEYLTLEKVTLYNNLGQIVKENKTAMLDIDALAKGTYFVEVKTNKGKASKSIIIQ